MRGSAVVMAVTVAPSWRSAKVDAASVSAPLKKQRPAFAKAFWSGVGVMNDPARHSKQLLTDEQRFLPPVI
ncbi:hypothetical protein [uncultured Thiocystis sp.]|jgi:hypothetical protein|uniref:hypothetical protein n=1 Tax=uncultured Thiocystis sp. TaxID=1202134 RepID=UPI0025FD2685|nr:hypothetical protein [uncultured Thiocystis sp.]